jgi:DNA-binding Xre family transcriptional regulator
MYLDLAKIRRLLSEKDLREPEGQWMRRELDGSLTPCLKADRLDVLFYRNPNWKPPLAGKERSGMTMQQWSNILNGSQSDNIKLATLYKIAAALDVHPGELLLAPTSA